MRRARKEKPIFRGLTIAVAGDLGGGQWTDANIARWVALRGGAFVRADGPGDGAAGISSISSISSSSSGGGGKPKEKERGSVVDGEGGGAGGGGEGGITHVVCSREEFRRGRGKKRMLC
ncbi:hypothetical protein VTK26DRAFT_5356 [Humicola hyalothermophila]